MAYQRRPILDWVIDLAAIFIAAVFGTLTYWFFQSVVWGAAVSGVLIGSYYVSVTRVQRYYPPRYWE